MQDISHIFRSYDIRGIYGKDINEEIMRKIGTAFVSFTKSAVLARDVRTSSPRLAKEFAAGFSEDGGTASDAGLLPLGVAMFHAWRSKRKLAYVTASHLPKEWNGVKFFHQSGMGFLEKENYRMRDIVMKGKARPKSVTKGRITEENSKKIVSDYITYVSKKIRAEQHLRIAADFGNGAGGLAGKKLLQSCGFEVVPVLETPDGNFPNRDPEPQENPLDALKEAMERSGSDLGIAYDGDADRMVLVAPSGRKLSAEQASYLILSALHEKGPVVGNVECSMLLDYVAKKFGRRVARIPVGHTFLVNESMKRGACLGVESSGHYIVPLLFPFDDALSVSAYAAYALSKHQESLDKIIDGLPEYHFTRVNVPCDDRRKFIVMKNLAKRVKSDYAGVSTIDGVRIDLRSGWALVRASNTSPLVRLSVEAETRKEMESIRQQFMQMLNDEIKKI